MSSNNPLEGRNLLPEGWTWTRLGKISEIILGQSPPSSTYNENGNGFPFYQGKLEFGNFYPIPRKWCTAPKKIAEKGDVLISVRAPVGPTNICPDKSCIGRGLAAIRGLGSIETHFILYLMRTFEQNLAGKGTGTTFNAISGNMLKEFIIPLPPLSEQHRIVSKIEELFTKLDSGVEALKKTQAQLKRYRQSVLKHAFEGELTKEWREAHKGELEPASVLLERIKEDRKKGVKGKYKELPPVGTSDLPELPEGWVWTKLGEIITFEYGRGLREDKRDQKGNVPVYGSNGIVGHHSVPLTEKPCLIVGRKGAAGNVHLSKVPCWPIDTTYYITPPDGLDLVFLYYLLSTLNLNSLDKSTAIPGLNRNDAYALKIPLPPLPEQHKIVEEIERRLSVADEMGKTIEQSLKQAKRLRQSILKKAFEGKLVPSDPSDEPASVLLERIKAEKAKREAEEKEKKMKKKSEKVYARQMRLMYNGK